MKPNWLRSSIAALTPLFALVSLSLGQSAPPASTEEQAIKLPEFTVSSSAADPYHPQNAISLARVSGALLDTPVSISVIPKELLNDLGANSSFEAARYMPGISNGRGSGTNGGIQERYNFRGFESETRTEDNFSMTLYPAINTTIDTFDPVFIERAELVMGPDAVLNPNGIAGGSVNIVSKSPLFTPQGMAQVEVGNYSAQKAAIDLTGPIPAVSNKLAYRVMATVQNTRTYITPGRFKKADLALELAYKFSDADVLTFKYFGGDFQAFGNASNPNNNGWLIFDPVNSVLGRTLPDHPTTPGIVYNGQNGGDTYSSTQERTNTVELVYNGTLFNLVSMHLGGLLYEHHNVGNSAQPNNSTTETFDETTGQVTGFPASDFNPTAIPEVWHYGSTFNWMEELENDYAANFQFWGVSLQPATGWSFQHDYQPVNVSASANLPADNLFAGTYAVPRPDLSTFTQGNPSKIEDSRTQVYATTKWGFFQDRIFADAGLERSWVFSETYAFTPTNHHTPTSNSSPLIRQYKDSYFLGLLAKVTKNISVYYSRSTNASVTPQTPTPTSSSALWSQGFNNEWGIKTEWLDGRLSVNADRFVMSQNNQATQNPAAFSAPVGTVPGLLLSNNVNSGYEFAAQGGLTKNLSVIASYTTMKYRDTFARRIRNVPDRMASLLLDYHFTSGALKGLAAFLGESYTGSTAGETAGNDPLTKGGFTTLGVPTLPGYYIAAWSVMNGGASYTWSRYKVALNVDNVLDQHFGWQPASRLTVAPYPSTTFRLTTTVNF